MGTMAEETGRLVVSGPDSAISESQLLAILCRFLQLCLDRYEAGITSETLAVLMILAMDRVGHAPTVSELAEIVGVPQSSMSRYVAHQIKIGHLEELILPSDRRRRILQPTAAGREEFSWIMGEISAISQSVGRGHDDLIAVLAEARETRNQR